VTRVIISTGHRIQSRMPNPHDYQRPWRTPWALILYLLAYFALLIVLLRVYLIPATRAFAGATSRERQLLSANSLLLLSVILFILIVGLILTFRVGRFFFPRPTERRVQTRYVDAWAEAGKRAEIETDDE